MSQVQAPPDPAPEVEGRSPVVTRPLLLSLVALGLVIVGLIFWSLFGRAPQTVEGVGYLVPDSGFTEVGAVSAGLVTSVEVGAGEDVRAGQTLVTLSIDGVTTALASPVDGTVIDVFAIPGRASQPGGPLVYLQPADSALVVKAFMPALSADSVRVGMTAGVSPGSAPEAAQYGVIQGEVTAISPTPVTRERLLAIVANNASLADYFLSRGPVLEVTIALQADPSTPSGYAWTIGQGPDVTLSAGALAKGYVVTRDSAPAAWLVP